LTLTVVTLGPPEGSRWLPVTDGEWQTWHLVDGTRRHWQGESRHHRLCGAPALTRIQVSVVMICASCMVRALRTKEGKDRL
jgi:hypothetical protein